MELSLNTHIYMKIECQQTKHHLGWKRNNSSVNLNLNQFNGTIWNNLLAEQLVH